MLKTNFGSISRWNGFFRGFFLFLRRLHQNIGKKIQSRMHPFTGLVWANFVSKYAKIKFWEKILANLSGPRVIIWIVFSCLACNFIYRSEHSYCPNLPKDHCYSHCYYTGTGKFVCNLFSHGQKTLGGILSSSSTGWHFYVFGGWVHNNSCQVNS